MKYLKVFNSYKLFESHGQEIYYISSNHHNELGYIWSPKILIGNGKSSHGRFDSSVSKIGIDDNGMSDTLTNRTVLPLFQEVFGTSKLDELCGFYLQELGYEYGPMHEFSFLKDGLLEERCYYNISVPGKPDIIKQVPDFKGNYLDTVEDIIGYTFSKKERKDISMGRNNSHYDGSWHINVGLYDVKGIKMISTELAGTNCYILKRGDIEKLVDMTSTCNLYRYEDKDLQLERIGGKRLEYYQINDIFVDIMQDSTNEITLVDFHQINEGQVMVKFRTKNMFFGEELVSSISYSIETFESVYGFKFDKIDLTRNHTMYIRDSSDGWMLKDLRVFHYNRVEELMGIGVMEYNLHLRPHAMYIIFNII